jgi:hypothetical protein
VGCLILGTGNAPAARAQAPETPQPGNIAQIKGRFKMRNKNYLIGVVGIVVGVLLTSAAVVLAGNIDSPAGPTNAAAQMYTLDQIYQRLNNGTAATKMTTFTEPSSGPGSTMHTLDEIYALIGLRAQVPKTGQTKCYNASGTEILCSSTGQDGELQKGVDWPSPRFTDNSNGTVTDNLTGLIWLKNANWANATRTWATALTDMASLNSAGTMNSKPCGDTSTVSQK